MSEETETPPVEPTSERLDIPINGMSCASCARKVGKQLGNLKPEGCAACLPGYCRISSKLGVPGLISEIKRMGI